MSVTAAASRRTLWARRLGRIRSAHIGKIPERDEQARSTDDAMAPVVPAHYVSGTAFVPSALELRGVDSGSLSEDQHYAVHDRPRG